MASRKLKSTTPLPWSASDAASAEGPSSSTVSNVSAFLRRRRGSTILFTLLAGLAFITLSQLPPGPFFSGSYAPKSDAREAVNPLQSEIAQSLKQQLSSFSEVRDNWVAFPGSATSPLVHDLPRHSARKTINERLLSDACADLFISKGELCRLSPSEATELQDQSRLSVLYTYVNGSDPILSEIRTSLIESEDVQGRGGSPRHYRAHAELIHSIRSTLRAFAKHLNDHLASIHIYTTDLPDPYLTHRPDGSLNPPAEKDRRWGYKPTWLSNVQKQWKHGNVDLRMEFPWNTYRAHNLSLQEAHLWRDAGKLA